MRRSARNLAVFPALALVSATAPGLAETIAAETAQTDREEAARTALKALMASDPEHARLQYDLVKAHAGLAVRIERLVSTGVLCKLLNEEDANLIVANGRQEMEFGQSILLEKQQADFAIYLEGLRKGAAMAVDPGMPSDAECAAFAKPGGTLVKLLTWTGRRQYLSPGILANPQTIP